MTVTTNLQKASPASFELVFPILPEGVGLSSGRELTLNIFSTIIPGVTMDVEEQRWQGTKTTQAAGVLTFEQWNVNFLVDSELLNWKSLFNWLVYINNNKDKMLENPEDYVVDATLRVIDNFGSGVFKLYFVNVWINALAELTMSHREGDQQLECNAQFVYDRFELRED